MPHPRLATPVSSCDPDRLGAAISDIDRYFGFDMDQLNAILLRAQASNNEFMSLARNMSFGQEADELPDFGEATELEQLVEEEKEAQPVEEKKAEEPPAKKRLRSPSRPPRNVMATSSKAPAPGPPPPPPPPPSQRRHRREVSEEELLDLRAEQKAAEEMGLRWQDRGPPPDLVQGDTWRGQRYRPGTGKWANRGGENKQWYSGFYAAKKAGPEAVAAYLAAHPHPKKQE